jgi:hypothetical protein
MRTSQVVAIGSRREARKLFAGLPAAKPEDMRGRWDGRMLGGPALIGLAKTVALLTPFRAWCGKDFHGGGRVTNLAMRHGRVTPVQDGITSFGRSRLDGQPAAIVGYRETAALPTRWMRGEMRWVDPGSVALGMLFMPFGSHIALGPFPYLLTRSQD